MEYKGSEDIDREDTACCTIFWSYKYSYFTTCIIN